MVIIEIGLVIVCACGSREPLWPGDHLVLVNKSQSRRNPTDALHLISPLVEPLIGTERRKMLPSDSRIVYLERNGISAQ